jgi:hypothetical protein
MRQQVFFVALMLTMTCARVLAQENLPATQPTKITIKMDDVHPREVLAELAKQGHVFIEPNPKTLWEDAAKESDPPPTKVSIDIQDKPFWVALAQVCEECDLTPQGSANGDAIPIEFARHNGAFDKCPVSDGALATFVAMSIGRSSSIDFAKGNDQAERTCHVGLTGYFDPRLRIIEYHDAPAIESARDENGNDIALVPAEPDESTSNPSNPWGLGVEIPLNYQDNLSHKLALLKGAVHATNAIEFERFEIDVASAQGVEKSIGGCELSFIEVIEDKKVRKYPKLHAASMKLRVRRGEVKPEDWAKMQTTIEQGIGFQSADGRSCVVDHSRGSNRRDDYEFTLTAPWKDEAQKPVKIVCEIPTKTEEIDLPFEFKDLPLP